MLARMMLAISLVCWGISGAMAQEADPKPADAKQDTAKPAADKADAPKTEAPKTEPAKDEPAKTEPAKEEPAKTEPTKTEPAKEEPAKSEPAKTEAKSAAPKTDAPAAAGKPAAVVEFDKQFAEWKDLLVKMRQIHEQYPRAKDADKPAMKAEFETLRAQGHTIMPKLFVLAEKAYVADPTNKQISDFLVSFTVDFAKVDRYDNAARLGKVLVDNGTHDPKLMTELIKTAMVLNDYDTARAYIKIAKADGDQSAMLDSAAEQIAKDEPLWKAEQAIRAEEAKADDLPRVKIKTRYGDIVVELFENEAPNTVANFISLVEKGYYDGLKFHRVIGGFMAQTGDPEGTGRGGPGYTIDDEVSGKFRRHFRGSLSMAKTQAPNSGGSQFYLTFGRPSHLDGIHTVFGRVVEGMDVLEKIARTEMESGPTGFKPDAMEKLTVVRKRDHKYEPKTNPGG